MCRTRRNGYPFCHHTELKHYNLGKPWLDRLLFFPKSMQSAPEHTQRRKKNEGISEKFMLNKRDFICRSLCLSKMNKKKPLWKQISRTSNLHNKLFFSSTCLVLYNKSLWAWQCAHSCHNALGESEAGPHLTSLTDRCLTSLVPRACFFRSPPGRVHAILDSHWTMQRTGQLQRTPCTHFSCNLSLGRSLDS